MLEDSFLQGNAFQGGQKRLPSPALLLDAAAAFPPGHSSLPSERKPLLLVMADAPALCAGDVSQFLANINTSAHLIIYPGNPGLCSPGGKV